MINLRHVGQVNQSISEELRSRGSAAEREVLKFFVQLQGGPGAVSNQPLILGFI